MLNEWIECLLLSTHKHTIITSLPRFTLKPLDARSQRRSCCLNFSALCARVHLRAHSTWQCWVLQRATVSMCQSENQIVYMAVAGSTGRTSQTHHSHQWWNVCTYTQALYFSTNSRYLYFAWVLPALVTSYFSDYIFSYPSCPVKSISKFGDFDLEFFW